MIRRSASDKSAPQQSRIKPACHELARFSEATHSFDQPDALTVARMETGMETRMETA